jgi:hypothetical protein
MTPETLIPDPSRFVNHDNDVIALEAIFIIVLILYICWKEIIAIKERRENNKTLQEVAEALNKLVGASNAKK